MREACSLRLMQADGMNDNLSGNPAMPPPTGTTVPDREGITDRYPSALIAAGEEITYSHTSAILHQEWKSQAATPLPSSQQEQESQAATPLPPRSRNRNHKQPPLCRLAAGMEITYRHPYACFQQQPISPDSCQGCPGDISVYIKV